MSFKGVKKALSRTPHQLIGKKINFVDDETISTWEHDLTTTIAGLTYIQSETKKYRNLFESLFKEELHICELMKEEEYDTSEDQKNNAKNISHFQDVISNVSDDVDRKFDQMDIDVGFRCNEMKGYIENLLKMLKKRNHKKMDFEIASRNVEKSLTKKSNFNEKEVVTLKKEQDQVEISKQIFYDIDGKVKIIIPEALDILSEFLNRLVLSFDISVKDVYTTIGKALEKFSTIQGLSSVNSDDIIKEWQQDFTSPKFTLDSMTLLNKYKDSPPSPTSTTFNKTRLKKEVTAFGGHALDSTTLLFKKTIHPRTTSINIRNLKLENPVQPKLPSGIFTSAVDPLSHLDTPNVMVSVGNAATLSPIRASSTPVPESPGFKSSPWLKPLSLKRQSQKSELGQEEDQLEHTISGSTVRNDTIYGAEPDAEGDVEPSAEVSAEPETVPETSETAETVAESEALPMSEDLPTANTAANESVFEEVDFQDDTTNTSTDAIKSTDVTKSTARENSIDLLIAEIKRIRMTYSKHFNSNECPTTPAFHKAVTNEYYVDDKLRFQIASNGTLSAQLLKAHLQV